MTNPQINTHKKIMHIDYDSFFASVEQQANPYLRNKPIVISGGKKNRGIACTASIQAKKLGIKTGMPVFQIRQRFPQVLIVKGDFAKYTYIHKKSLEIFNKYTDMVEPFSIDEAFLDVTATEMHFESAQNIAHLIKKDILESFGPYVTCSIGIGPNKLLAKLVSDFNKPNGIFTVDSNNVQDVLESCKLNDFCGIGPRLLKRLNDLNIYTVKELQQTPLHVLYANFGNVTGSFLKNSSLGIGYGEVHSIEYKTKPKSVSHQHTLYNITSDTKVLQANLCRLSEMVVRRLRKNEMLCKKISIILRDKQGTYHQSYVNINMPTDSFIEIEKHVRELFKKIGFKGSCKFIGVRVSNLVDKNCRTLPLFYDYKKQERINNILDEVNGKFGEFTLSTANTLVADKTKNKMSSFLRHN